jgi:hypothetical protein
MSNYDRIVSRAVNTDVIISDYEIMDCFDLHETGLVQVGIEFYGEPAGSTENDDEKIRNGDFSSLSPLGVVNGYLILCTQMINMGEDPLIICDDINGNFSFVIGKLSESDGPLAIDEFQNVFYMTDFTFELHEQITIDLFNHLAETIFAHYHVYPDIIAYYPLPLEYTKTESESERLEILKANQQEYIAYQIDKIYGAEVKQNSNISQFSHYYSFSEEEHNLLNGYEAEGASYPESAKNKEEFSLFEKLGYQEFSNSRLLYSCNRNF